MKSIPHVFDHEVPLVTLSVKEVTICGGPHLVVSNVVNEEVASVPTCGETGPIVTIVPVVVVSE